MEDGDRDDRTAGVGPLALRQARAVQARNRDTRDKRHTFAR